MQSRTWEVSGVMLGQPAACLPHPYSTLYAITHPPARLSACLLTHLHG